MATNSMSWPNMFDVSRGKVNLYSDQKSLINRIKLLLLTEPTELYMVPNFGVGLRKHLFKYNNDNVLALIKDDLIEQLRLWEPGVIANSTTIERGPNHSWDPNNRETVSSRMNILDLIITVQTVYAQTVSFNIDNTDVKMVV